MQKKKERIMMQSLRRKQQGEENRLRKLEEERLKKEEEAAKEEERNRKKEEERAKREAILAQHKLKKEMDRAEEEVNFIFWLFIYTKFLQCVPLIKKKGPLKAGFPGVGTGGGTALITVNMVVGSQVGLISTSSTKTQYMGN